MLEPEQVILFSAQTGDGRAELLEAVMDIVATPPSAESL
jgi:hypothetical protein